MERTKHFTFYSTERKGGSVSKHKMNNWVVYLNQWKTQF
jgi:predicted transcriptional regulator